MATFKPFKAFRPTKETVTAIASKPYDTLNKKEAIAAAEGNPLSFYHVIKPEINFPNSTNDYVTEVYEKGKESFDKLVADGAMVQDAQACFYVYHLNMDGHEQTGLVGCCSIDDYFNNHIKKHELTRPDKEEDRKNHVRASKLNYEPVFLFYPHLNTLDEVISQAKQGEPTFDFTADDGIQHSLWVIDDENAIEQISALFEQDIPSIYIADGHHRTAANALVAEEFRSSRNGQASDGGNDNYFMAVLFPDNQLKILDYNRVVKDLHGLTEEAFIARISENFTIEESDTAYRPEHMHTFGMYLNKKWYKLSAKEGTFDPNDPVGQLDVDILSKNVLEPILNIVDLRKDKRIDFVGGMRGLGELEKRVDSDEMKVAFSMYPVSMQQLMTVSDEDLIMPPKVTWFEPKLRSGLFVYSIDE